MPDLRGLTIVIADISSERFRCALAMAAAHAALGGHARVFLQGESVSIIRQPIEGWEDDAYVAAGQPTLATLLEEALGLDVKIILCQSALQMTGALPADFDPRVEYGGMLSILQSLGDDRLVAV